MYHTDGILTKMGFSQIKYGNPQKGDIYVQDRTKTHEDGHIAIYNEQIGYQISFKIVIMCIEMTLVQNIL